MHDFTDAESVQCHGTRELNDVTFVISQFSVHCLTRYTISFAISCLFIYLFIFRFMSCFHGFSMFSQDIGLGLTFDFWCVDC